MSKYTDAAIIKKPRNDELCKFNIGVCCNDYSKCAKCGWNPDEQQRRHAKTLEKYKT